MDKKKQRLIAECRAAIFEGEHQAALALESTEKAFAARNLVKVFKAHKRAGKFAWQAARAKNKLWETIYPHRPRHATAEPNRTPKPNHHLTLNFQWPA